jgi:hypothetical protein
MAAMADRYESFEAANHPVTKTGGFFCLLGIFMQRCLINESLTISYEDGHSLQFTIVAIPVAIPLEGNIAHQ